MDNNQPKKKGPHKPSERNMIKNTTCLTQKNVKDFFFYDAVWGHLLVTVAMPLFLIFLGVSLLAAQNTDKFFGIGMLVAAALLPAIMFWQASENTRKCVIDRVLLKAKPVEYMMGDKGIGWVETKGDQAIPHAIEWVQIYKVAYTKKYVYIYTGENVPIILETDKFTKGTVDDLKKITNLIDRKKQIRKNEIKAAKAAQKSDEKNKK